MRLEQGRSRSGQLVGPQQDSRVRLRAGLGDPEGPPLSLQSCCQLNPHPKPSADARQGPPGGAGRGAGWGRVQRVLLPPGKPPASSGWAR